MNSLSLRICPRTFSQSTFFAPCLLTRQQRTPTLHTRFSRPQTKSYISLASMPPRRGGGSNRRGRKSSGAPYQVPESSSHAGSAARMHSRTQNQDKAPAEVAPAAAIQPKSLVPKEGQELTPYATMEGVLDKGLLAGLKAVGFEYMTDVQKAVLTKLPSFSADCLVQAKTGTGKTAAFLLPALQNILAGNAPPKGKVGILVICPTRELALQIAKECEGVTSQLHPKMECHTAFGGTKRDANLKIFIRGQPMILVATPGRLDDILGEEDVREKFSHLKTLVLDEADRMLDAGFAPAIYKIMKRLPPKNSGWQGMCFSATLPDKVNDVVKGILFPGYTSLSTMDPNESPTIDRVPQFAITVPSVTQTFAALLALIDKEHAANPDDFKIIVFGTTANGVGLLYDMCKEALPSFNVFELHSRMSQNARTHTTNDFKAAARGILIASDVVGRGMDFPNVGLVVQVGLPMNTEQYIHRVGRTARAGRDGRAVMILFQNEAFFPRTNPSLPIKPYPVDVVAELPTYQAAADKALVRVDENAKTKAYQAFLGYNKMYIKKLNLTSVQLVKVANDYAMAMGCPEVPMIDKKVVGKMGLKGVPGLNVGTYQREQPERRRR